MAATAPERMLLVDGEWVETGNWVEVSSPYDGAPVARVAKAGAAEARAAVDAAERAMRNPLPAHCRLSIPTERATIAISAVTVTCGK